VDEQDLMMPDYADYGYIMDRNSEAKAKKGEGGPGKLGKRKSSSIARISVNMGPNDRDPAQSAQKMEGLVSLNDTEPRRHNREAALNAEGYMASVESQKDEGSPAFGQPPRQASASQRQPAQGASPTQKQIIRIENCD